MSLGITQGTTFSFLSIDVNKITANYNQNVYGLASNLPSFKDLLSIKSVGRQIDKTMDSSPLSDIFSVKNRSGTGSIIATDSCSAYNEEGEIVRRCNYCRRDFKLPKPFQVIKDFKTTDSHDVDVLGIDQCCSPNCAYGLALEGADRDSIYFTRAHYGIDGSNPLPKSWRLLKINGGSMIDGEWDDITFKYVMQSSYVFPIKRTYEKVIY